MKYMGTLDNLENAWDDEFFYESSKIAEVDAMGREKFWEDLGRPENDGLALKIFQEQGCSNCSCKPTQP
jgi:hypothetical protein